MDSNGSNDKVAFSWIELFLVFLIVMLAMGVFAVAEWQVRERQKDKEPGSIAIQISADVPQAQAEVNVLAAERDGYQEALAAERVALAQGSISLTAVAARYPSPDARPDEVVQAQQTAVAAQALTMARIPLLETQVAEAVGAVSSAELDLAKKEQTAAEMETEQRRVFTTNQQATVLGFSLAGTAVLLFLGLLVVWVSGIHEEWEISRFEVCALSLGFILLLYGYQAFEWFGVAGAAVLVLMGLVVAAVRWRRGETKPEERQP